MFKLNSCISFLSLNVRGLRDNTKRKATFLFCKERKAQCVLLQETHSCGSDRTFWSNQWGEPVLFAHGTTRSGGVAFLFNNFPGKLVESRSSLDGHWLFCVQKIENCYIVLGNVYGYNNLSQNKSLISEMSLILEELKTKYATDLIILGGDFNMVYDEWLDRSPTKYNANHYNSLLSNFCNNQGLIDPWRESNPSLRQFTWFKPDASCKSRIDFWLISHSFLPYQTISSISAAPLTDHCSIELMIYHTNKPFRNKGYWKFNSNLLGNEDYTKLVKDTVLNILNDNSLVSWTSKWEFFKYKVRQLSISYSKQLKKSYNLKETSVIKEINEYSNKSILTEDDRSRLLLLQAELDEIYMRKAKGAYIRSRAKWMEKGEKNSAYFCRLEKKRQERNSIKTLIINGTECSNSQLIAKEIANFYQNLYSSSSAILDPNSLFEKIGDFVPHIDDQFKMICDADLIIEDLDSAVMCLSLDKSPGPDGMTANFYRHFWDLLREFLFAVFQEITKSAVLPNSMRQGLITLIPKPGKDPRLLDNLRPITLLNTDYKLLTHIYNNRLKLGLSKIIGETQTGFIRGRSIHNNIRLVLDLLEYNQEIVDDGVILFLDFYKAFDMLEHSFIFKCLKMYGFGEVFCNIIQLFYTNTNSSVALPTGTSPRFDIKRGVKQGCPISPSLFILATEMLALLIKNSSIEKLNVFGQEIILSQLADDTTLFLKGLDQVPKVIEIVNYFSKFSGLKLNIAKCEIITIHECPLKIAYNIPIKSTVKYLGISISKDEVMMEKQNVWNRWDECKGRLDAWMQRDLSIFGRIYLTKMESLSRCIYPASCLSISNRAIKTINQINFNYIWRKRVHYIKRAQLVQDYENGGLQAFDFYCMNGMLKIKWLKHFITNENSFWFCIPRGIFRKLGGIDFLLRCDYTVSRLPIKLSSFHQQILLYWKLL